MSQVVSLAGYDFPDNKACIACTHVLDGDPVLVFSHEEDGDLQFMCGRQHHSLEEASVVDIEDVLQKHPDLTSLPVVVMGQVAERDSLHEDWRII